MNNSSLTAEALVKAFFYSILIILGLVFLFLIRDILLVFFIAIILSLAFDSPIDWLQKRGVHRILGTIFFYLLIFSIFSIAFYLLAMPLSEQIGHFSITFPVAFQKIGVYFDNFNLEGLLNNFSDSLVGGGRQIFGSVVQILGGLASAAFILIISIYLNAREKGVKKFLLGLVPIEHRVYALSLIDQIQVKMGNWIWGIMIDSFCVGLFIYLGLTILGVDYALFFGVLAAFCNLIPYVGPITSAVPPIVFALLQSPILALWVIIVFLFVHSIIEEILVRPFIMKKVVGVDPLLIIFTVLSAGKLAGFAGVLLAIPTAAIISIIIQEYKRLRMKDEYEIIK